MEPWTGGGTRLAGPHHGHVSEPVSWASQPWRYSECCPYLDPRDIWMGEQQAWGPRESPASQPPGPDFMPVFRAPWSRAGTRVSAHR